MASATPQALQSQSNQIEAWALAWALSSPAMAPQQKSSGMPPTAPPVLQQAPPLSGFLPGAPDTPNPTAYHGCCFHNLLPISHQGTWSN